MIYLLFVLQLVTILLLVVVLNRILRIERGSSKSVAKSTMTFKTIEQNEGQVKK